MTVVGLGLEKCLEMKELVSNCLLVSFFYDVAKGTVPSPGRLLN